MELEGAFAKHPVSILQEWSQGSDAKINEPVYNSRPNGQAWAVSITVAYRDHSSPESLHLERVAERKAEAKRQAAEESVAYIVGLMNGIASRLFPAAILAMAMIMANDRFRSRPRYLARHVWCSFKTTND